ncbi:MAG: 50S ribosomal protein L21e [Candidatus Aenigmatarchaeota archaeon]
MVQKSRGQRARTRYKMQAKRQPAPNDFLKRFEPGQAVHVCLQPNIRGQGYSYTPFHGLTGKVIGKRGSAYVVQIRDGRAQKKLVLSPVHLRLAKS